ncbi:putative tubulin [Babesia divergens]|uniref:Tubulin n=1 Tax=Babesia divergens TaxID=32595 RepID=A0AAD9GDD9_BABDI|nr:putative tubulin [Babesia divergens]
MKEVLNINLGQCGIQVAGLFWETFSNALKLSDGTRRAILEEAQCFFWQSNKEAPFEDDGFVDSSTFVSGLRSRCILVDTEVGTVSEILQRKHLNNIDNTNIVCGTEATGGNWSTAYYDYGPQYHDALEELLIKNAEHIDECFQYFNLTFAISGGAGSGLGSYMLDLLKDEYPKVYRICNVITQDTVAAVSPYNTVLCLQHLNDMGNITNLFSNEALLQQAVQSTAPILRESKKSDSNDSGFNNINALIVEHLKEFGLATISKRTPGFNMNSVVNTLTPLPSLNLMCPAAVPKQLITKGATTEALLNELMRPSNRICPVPLKQKAFPIAMAIDGDFDTSSFKYVKRLKLKHNMVGWMRDGIKLSIPGAFAECNGGPHEKGVYAIVNDCGISSFLRNSLSNFDRLYSKKAFLHHFSQLLDPDEFSNARYHVDQLRSDYDEIYTSTMPPHRLLDEASLTSIGVKLNRLKNEQYTDIWNTTPPVISSDKPNWWELNGAPLV